MSEQAIDKWVESISAVAYNAIGACSVADSPSGTVRFDSDDGKQSVIINEDTLEIIEIYQGANEMKFEIKKRIYTSLQEVAEVNALQGDELEILQYVYDKDIVLHIND